MWGVASLVPSPSIQLLSLAVRITRHLRVIHTASDDSCGGSLGMRLGRGLMSVVWSSISMVSTHLGAE